MRELSRGVDGLQNRNNGGSICMMKEWEISTSYLLPRILSVKRRRNNTLPTKLPKPNLRVLPLGDANARWSVWRRSDYFYPEMIPEPDYSESEDSDSEMGRPAERFRELEEESENEEDIRKRRTAAPLASSETLEDLPSMTSSPSWNRVPPPPPPSGEGLIKPKKPSNPYLESTERQNLHRELKFSQKYGKNGANQRSELQKALEKYAENKLKKELAAARQTSLEKILAEQARKIEQQEREGTADIRPNWIEHLEHSQQPFMYKDPKRDEFYRVHAKVIGNSVGSSVSTAEVSDSKFVIDIKSRSSENDSKEQKPFNESKNLKIFSESKDQKSLSYVKDQRSFGEGSFKGSYSPNKFPKSSGDLILEIPSNQMKVPPSLSSESKSSVESD